MAVPGATASEFEFLELTNTSPGVTLDLAGARFVEGVTFTFPGGTTLAPGGRLVVVRNAAAFAARYGVPHVTLLLFDGSGEMTQVVRGPTDTETLRGIIGAHLATHG